MNNEIAKQIEESMKKLQNLREEFDRLDDNHPHQSTQIAKDIAKCVKEVESLTEQEKGATSEKS